MKIEQTNNILKTVEAAEQKDDILYVYRPYYPAEAKIKTVDDIIAVLRQLTGVSNPPHLLEIHTKGFVYVSPDGQDAYAYIPFKTFFKIYDRVGSC